MCDGFAPVAVPPSPNVQLYALIVPSGSVDPVPSNDTDWPVVGELGLNVKDAVGSRLAT